MRFSLMHLLVKSPVPRVHEVMGGAVSCAEMVPQLIDALVAGDRERLHRHAKEASQLEHLTDVAKNQVREHMPMRLMLPVDRRDVLHLISEIDGIADCAEDVGVLLTMRNLEVPSTLEPLLRDFVDRAMATVYASRDLVGMLGELLETGFGGSTARVASAKIEEVARKEHEADKVQDQLAKRLLSLEGELPTLSIVMWTKVFDKIGGIANHAENVGDQFRLFIAN